MEGVTFEGGIASSPRELSVDVRRLTFRAGQPDLDLRSLAGRIVSVPTGWRFQSLAARTAESALTVDGTLTRAPTTSPWAFDLDVTGQPVSLPEIGRFIPAAAFDLHPRLAVGVDRHARCAEAGRRSHAVGSRPGEGHDDRSTRPDPVAALRVASTVADVNLAPIVKDPCGRRPHHRRCDLRPAVSLGQTDGFPDRRHVHVHGPARGGVRLRGHQRQGHRRARRPQHQDRCVSECLRRQRQRRRGPSHGPGRGSASWHSTWPDASPASTCGSLPAVVARPGAGHRSHRHLRRSTAPLSALKGRRRARRVDGRGRDAGRRHDRAVRPHAARLHLRRGRHGRGTRPAAARGGAEGAGDDRAAPGGRRQRRLRRRGRAARPRGTARSRRPARSPTPVSTAVTCPTSASPRPWTASGSTWRQRAASRTSNSRPSPAWRRPPGPDGQRRRPRRRCPTPAPCRSTRRASMARSRSRRRRCSRCRSRPSWPTSRSTAGWLTVRRLEGSGDGFTLTGSGTVGVGSDDASDFRYRLEAAVAGRPAKVADLPLTGAATTEGRITGTRADFLVTGTLAGDQVAYSDTVTAGTVTAQYAVRVPDFDPARVDVQASVDGQQIAVAGQVLTAVNGTVGLHHRPGALRRDRHRRRARPRGSRHVAARRTPCSASRSTRRRSSRNGVTWSLAPDTTARVAITPRQATIGELHLANGDQRLDVEGTVGIAADAESSLRVVADRRRHRRRADARRTGVRGRWRADGDGDAGRDARSAAGRWQPGGDAGARAQHRRPAARRTHHLRRHARAARSRARQGRATRG